MAQFIPFAASIFTIALGKSEKNVLKDPIAVRPVSHGFSLGLGT
jgi:hypothetical protein